MAHQYANIHFTAGVKQVQQEMGSRQGYQGMESGPDYNGVLSQLEADFINERDSFYMASVGESDWPYIQHRGGKAGFMRVLDATTLGFADFSGNRQYISTGNFRHNHRVALFFMDYPNQRRLKLSGYIEQVPDHDLATLARLEMDDFTAPVERGFVIKVVGFDWNCPKYITPRFTEQEIAQLVDPLVERNNQLQSKLDRLAALEHDKAKDDDMAACVDKAIGSGDLPLVVSAVRQLTPLVRAYELRHREGKALPKISAGAHIGIPVVMPDKSQTTRYYSICSNPARRDVYEIAVLRQTQGQGGSQAIHAWLQLGQRLNCVAPEQGFALHDDARPSVLIAAGIGITAIKPMAQQLAATGRQFELHYAAKSKQHMAFANKLANAFAGSVQFYYSDQQQRMDLAEMLRRADPDSLFYLCGPERLIAQALAVAKQIGLDPERLRYQHFQASQITKEKQKASAFQVHLSQSDIMLTVAEDQTLLEALEQHQVALPSACRSGICGRCVVAYQDGEVSHQDACLSEPERQQRLCACVSRATSPSITIEL
ncbi:2Fe-2S iron-sulfur cluster-binding protein [Motilimonas eburnea]|uniref:2Fe-2S iron-sulfur cluster-binding protein n=1 Tax=Motilimonas eburnea TaxID=1737488 RepID=UPI001E3D93C9|nr:2Fe-2S iron-sulfur cluster-binding protein [Motilimonas eburnea]MCE2571270.1 pyridoxamine 5'-phosphate oxidase family protein [Motilimonas eburnea]